MKRCWRHNSSAASSGEIEIITIKGIGDFGLFRKLLDKGIQSSGSREKPGPITSHLKEA